jgi:hypothetical protein
MYVNSRALNSVAKYMPPHLLNNEKKQEMILMSRAKIKTTFY